MPNKKTLDQLRLEKERAELRLATLTQLIKRRAAKFQLRTMNRIFGGILCAFGILVFVRLFL